MKGYGEHWQYSVFFCVLRDIDRARMESELADILNLRTDQCILIDLGADEESAREAVVVLGESLPKARTGVVVV
jgi:CRISPR-associated protein Cas2